MGTHEEHDTEMVISESSPIEYAKFAGVLAAITLFAWWLTSGGAAAPLADFLRWFMGIFFVVFASFKFIGYEMFTVMFRGYDIVAKRYPWYSYAYPFIELLLGIFYLTDLLGIWRDIATILVMGIGTIGVWQEIQKRSGVHCACLGNVIKLPLSTVSLVEDVSMGVMALAMLII